MRPFIAVRNHSWNVQSMRSMRCASAALVAAVLAMSAREAAAATYSGEATVLQIEVVDVVDLDLVEAGPLPPAGGSDEDSLQEANVSQAGVTLTATALHAITAAQGNTSSSSASILELASNVAGVDISADVLTSDASATCDDDGAASIDGDSVITNLTVAGQNIVVSGAPNQTIPIQTGLLDVTVIVNEQTGTASGGTGDITVNALHILIDSTLTGGRVAEVIVSSAHADIDCAAAAEPCTTNADCDDTLFCNGAETCSPTDGCQPGVAPDCDDGLACTTDSCNEAADTCENISAVCGNGVVDPTCGEQCDTPGAEICNNGIDDDGDQAVDCADADCASTPGPGCSAQCQETPPCVPILGDPAFIQLPPEEQRSSSGAGYTFGFHGRVIPTTPVDPLLDGLAVLLTNDAGEIFRANIAPGQLEQRGRRYFVKLSEEQAMENGGIGSVFLRQRKDGGLSGYGIRVKSYGNMSRATLPEMTTQVYLGDDVAYLTATWTRKGDKWMLRRNQF